MGIPDHYCTLYQQHVFVSFMIGSFRVSGPFFGAHAEKRLGSLVYLIKPLINCRLKSLIILISPIVLRWTWNCSQTRRYNWWQVSRIGISHIPSLQYDIKSKFTSHVWSWKGHAYLKVRKETVFKSVTNHSFEHNKYVSRMVHVAEMCIHIWVVTRHQYGISVLVPETSFRGKPVVTTRNVGYFLRVLFCLYNRFLLVSNLLRWL